MENIRAFQELPLSFKRITQDRNLNDCIFLNPYIAEPIKNYYRV